MTSLVLKGGDMLLVCRMQTEPCCQKVINTYKALELKATGRVALYCGVCNRRIILEN
jgi:hypothetical protein